MEKIITDQAAFDQYIDLLGDEASSFIIDIIDTFLEDAPNQFSNLDVSLSKNDPETFRRAAHTLKTGCKTVGAMTLAEGFLELETHGESGDLSSMNSILNECKSKFDLLKSELIKKKETLK